MPGAITHLKTAYYILNNKIASVLRPEQFYLGSISPDSVNVNGHAPKEIRWPAHLRNKDLNQWLENARSFWQSNAEDAGDTSFLLGYIVHIITDIVWDMYFEAPLKCKFKAAGITCEQMKSERWAELYGYEQQEMLKAWFKDDVVVKLAVSQPEKVGTLKPEEVKAWRDNVVGLRLPPGHVPQFVDDNIIDTLCELVSETLLSVL